MLPHRAEHHGSIRLDIFSISIMLILNQGYISFGGRNHKTCMYIRIPFQRVNAGNRQQFCTGFRILAELALKFAIDFLRNQSGSH